MSPQQVHKCFLQQVQGNSSHQLHQSQSQSSGSAWVQMPVHLAQPARHGEVTTPGRAPTTAMEPQQWVLGPRDLVASPSQLLDHSPLVRSGLRSLHSTPTSQHHPTLMGLRSLEGHGAVAQPGGAAGEVEAAVGVPAQQLEYHRLAPPSLAPHSPLLLPMAWQPTTIQGQLQMPAAPARHLLFPALMS
jgi:hypothetical protein